MNLFIRYLSDKVFSVKNISFRNHLFKEVDNSSLVYFRIAFGAIMLWSVYRYFDHGWIDRYYIDQTFHFKYYGFGWVESWPGNGMVWHFYALGALALCMMLGLFYRLSAILNFIGFTYVFLLDKSNYLNHYYLVCLVSFLMIFLPMNRAFSLDAILNSKIHSNRAPAWTLWLLRIQIGIPYFYGGLAKLNWDWLRGEPMRMWLGERTDFPIIGSLFKEDWMIYLFSYGGLSLDLFVVPFLLFRKTRIYAFIFSILFHTLNVKLFSIGIFPWFMIAGTALFFPPNWPRRLLQRLQLISAGTKTKGIKSVVPQSKQNLIMTLCGIYLAIQFLAPLRHFLYPGNVSWTEEGHNFSWHMKLRDKDSKIRFYLRDPIDKKEWEVNLREYLNRRQIRKMSKRPDLLLSFSHYISKEMSKFGLGDFETRAWVMASLNGRKPQLLINRTVNLAAEPRNLKPKHWIIPLVMPLKSPSSMTDVRSN